MTAQQIRKAGAYYFYFSSAEVKVICVAPLG